MIKNAILNTELLCLLSRIGHTQTICVCDAGLPVPQNSQLIDLSVVPGCPDIQTVLTAILQCTPTEKAYCASESLEKNPGFVNFLTSMLTYDITYVSHEQLKELSHDCMAYVRTGECTPYANVILQAATTF